MSPLPLPSALTGLLELKGKANRALLFDRGFPGYAEDWGPNEDKEAKRRFLAGFQSHFTAPPGFSDFVARRRQALKALGARSAEPVTQSRLVVGLGLPHPTETGFLLDRLTGCPYLPGSSVKGLLRAAARLVAAGELSVVGASEGAAFLTRHVERLFGPELAPGVTPARGELVVYDALPTRWPTLELDVLTPHHGDYYTGERNEPPADWYGPVPVTFLTVAPETPFCFFFRSLNAASKKDDEDLMESLLTAALDWLGAGGKTSAGYGVLAPSRSRFDRRNGRFVGRHPGVERSSPDLVARPDTSGDSQWQPDRVG